MLGGDRPLASLGDEWWCVLGLWTVDLECLCECAWECMWLCRCEASCVGVKMAELLSSEMESLDLGSKAGGRRSTLLCSVCLSSRDSACTAFSFAFTALTRARVLEVIAAAAPAAAASANAFACCV